MIKRITFIFIMLFSIVLISCSSNQEPTDNMSSSTVNDNMSSSTVNTKESAFIMKIDGTEMSVSWENNDSVKELKEYVKDGYTIITSQYGGFEQVGSIGKTIKSNDQSIKTNPGDICLYQSNQIVIFYGSNRYSYTKLGHINLSESELTSLLAKDRVTITFNK